MQLSDKDELLSTQRRDMSASFDELARRQVCLLLVYEAFSY
jgi:hypothetical protein